MKKILKGLILGFSLFQALPMVGQQVNLPKSNLKRKIFMAGGIATGIEIAAYAYKNPAILQNSWNSFAQCISSKAQNFSAVTLKPLAAQSAMDATNIITSYQQEGLKSALNLALRTNSVKLGFGIGAALPCLGLLAKKIWQPIAEKRELQRANQAKYNKDKNWVSESPKVVLTTSKDGKIISAHYENGKSKDEIIFAYIDPNIGGSIVNDAKNCLNFEILNCEDLCAICSGSKYSKTVQIGFRSGFSYQKVHKQDLKLIDIAPDNCINPNRNQNFNCYILAYVPEGSSSQCHVVPFELKNSQMVCDEPKIVDVQEEIYEVFWLSNNTLCIRTIDSLKIYGCDKSEETIESSALESGVNFKSIKTIITVDWNLEKTILLKPDVKNILIGSFNGVEAKNIFVIYQDTIEQIFYESNKDNNVYNLSLQPDTMQHFCNGFIAIDTKGSLIYWAADKYVVLCTSADLIDAKKGFVLTDAQYGNSQYVAHRADGTAIAINIPDVYEEYIKSLDWFNSVTNAKIEGL